MHLLRHAFTFKLFRSHRPKLQLITARCIVSPSLSIDNVVSLCTYCVTPVLTWGFLITFSLSWDTVNCSYWWRSHTIFRDDRNCVTDSSLPCEAGKSPIIKQWLHTQVLQWRSYSLLMHQKDMYAHMSWVCLFIRCIFFSF